MRKTEKVQLNMEKKFDPGAVRLSYNRKRTETGPGQFKLDPYLVKTGALDNVVKTIKQSNRGGKERSTRNQRTLPLKTHCLLQKRNRKSNDVQTSQS